MATLNVKGFPDDLYARLQAQAKRDRRSVAQQVSFLLAEALEPPKTLSILDLEGLGKELWDGIDPAEYIENERASWDS